MGVGTAGGGTTPGTAGAAVGVLLAPLKVRLVTRAPFLIVTSFFSTLMATTSTDSMRSPSDRIGFNIGLPGAGMTSSSTRLLDRMLVMPVTSTCAVGTGAGGGALVDGSGG